VIAAVACVINVAEIDECASNPCMNEGMCVHAVKSFDCHCSPGYTGKNCETGKLAKVLLL